MGLNVLNDILKTAQTWGEVIAGPVAAAKPEWHSSSLFIGDLEPFQKDGVLWLDSLFMNGANGILADEMGLGKTVQTIALICRLIEHKFEGCNLVVCPLTTIHNWEEEFARFAPRLSVLVFHGDKEECKRLKRKVRGLNVVLTSYEMVSKNDRFFSSLALNAVVVDEGHRLKNSESILYGILMRLHSEFRLLLTGTPLQNNLSELWSLLHFLFPVLYASVDDFRRCFDFEITENGLNKEQILNLQKSDDIVSKMHKILAPFMLRRMKADVSLSIPPKKELVVHCPMSRLQKELYDAIRSQTIDKYIRSLFGGLEINLKETKSFAMAARKACCHPYMFPNPVFDNRNLMERHERLEKLVRASGKLELLDVLLHRIIADHKILIFSQFTTMLDILEIYVDLKGYNYFRFDGSTALETRRNSIRQFNEGGNGLIFLISTRAGGVGINLATADTVIIYDSDWNPQMDLQAQDRAHRLGQKRPVTVFRLISENSFEDKMYSRAQAKRKLEKMVIGQGRFDDPMHCEQAIDCEDLEDLLEEEDATQIRVVQDGEAVISAEDLEGIINQCAVWFGTDERINSKARH